jgi:hypothetical protein
VLGLKWQYGPRFAPGFIGGARHIVVGKFSTLDNGSEQKNSSS